MTFFNGSGSKCSAGLRIHDIFNGSGSELPAGLRIHDIFNVSGSEFSEGLRIHDILNGSGSDLVPSTGFYKVIFQTKVHVKQDDAKIELTFSLALFLYFSVVLALKCLLNVNISIVLSF